MELGKKKVRVAMVASNLEKNGISTVIMNYCTHLDLDLYDITIIVGKKVDAYFLEICHNLKITIVELPYRKTEPKKYYLKFNSYLSKNKFDIVHVHGSNSSIGLELLIAKLHRIPVRIAHCHNSFGSSVKIHKLMKPVLNWSYTNAFACGQLAGEWMFGNRPFTIIRNGFDVAKFAFDVNFRTKWRKKLNLESKLVLGHVGWFNFQKNQKFLLKLLKQTLPSIPNAHLLLVGGGQNLSNIKQTASDLGLESRVTFLGEIDVPEEIYSAMDCFVFPSRFEGLPIAMLEAQISGLPCIMSTNVTQEVVIGSTVKCLSLDAPLGSWTKAITKLSEDARTSFVSVNARSITKYQIENCVQELNEEYIAILKKKVKVK
ncbi:glycosyltransferase [Lacticaseibacillus jixiensis]|uniref:glycosyltransferase n=1 Tax=Lacticaseibacillus jixiensis TaxID=3231926 RepID=UPI0036F1CD2D